MSLILNLKTKLTLNNQFRYSLILRCIKSEINLEIFSLEQIANAYWNKSYDYLLA